MAETLDALGNATTYAAGAFGTVLSVTDPAGTVSYTYDTLGHRLTERSLSSNSYCDVVTTAANGVQIPRERPW